MKLSKPLGLLVAAGLLGSTLLITAQQGVQAETAKPTATPAGLSKATFAGGCFWSMQHAFENIENMVVSSTVGYIGGHTKNPSYEEVSAGDTGHVEAVQIVYDPKKISYDKLLDIFWHNVDPVNDHGQFCDNGNEYRSEIFYDNAEQQQKAESTKATLVKSGKLDQPLVTKIVAAPEFYPAEGYHQHFTKTNPEHYERYRQACKRGERLQEIWGKTAS